MRVVEIFDTDVTGIEWSDHDGLTVCERECHVQIEIFDSSLCFLQFCCSGGNWLAAGPSIAVLTVGLASASWKMWKQSVSAASLSRKAWEIVKRFPTTDQLHLPIAIARVPTENNIWESQPDRENILVSRVNCCTICLWFWCRRLNFSPKQSLQQQLQPAATHCHTQVSWSQDFFRLDLLIFNFKSLPSDIDVKT